MGGRYWSLTLVRLCFSGLAILITDYGSRLQGKPIGGLRAGLLFLICAAFVVGLPCFRNLDRRYIQKHGFELKRFMKYGFLGLVHGTSRWIFAAACLGKFLAIPERGWGVTLQIPALMMLGLAYMSGYPGLESFVLAVQARAMSKAERKRKAGVRPS